ncbi:hypothetical protein [Streptomyces clavuligerus]|uniref:Secreted protein n=1 Tax=Streptomyces clavuligerus TaxID=1901 RepID=B5GLK5_STRCL|nr:hypothetical protein [Streptomyces clavuligerus]EDY47201.1 hypothetical protein SSCG_00229 [Streptomyces clavuligerus]EFG04869.1 Hypothetical protein SCLAV_p1385 [Streptomyces clavuligerus]MBY6306691.1 hypothetical protein [Streptomyces clavuligerus]QCS10702.1 hypothetical protein CRV15_34845 [Streptomyces clavuligerus]QPJ97262.1 hypothetical protein GE265_29630 [Streptomyces clavuligerus]
MAHSSASRPRSLAVALAAAGLLVGGITSAQAAPAKAAAAPKKSVAVAEVRTFTGTGMGVSPSQAVDSAVRTTYRIAQAYGWQANQCHVHSTGVRSVGSGLYSAAANLFCQR